MELLLSTPHAAEESRTEPSENTAANNRPTCTVYLLHCTICLIPP